jgi:hypothetical protein
MDTLPLAVSRVTPQQRAAADADFPVPSRSHFPNHSDIALGLSLLSFWKTLAANRLGTVLACGRNRSNSSSSSSSGSLQATVLPTCDLAVNLLKAWPPKATASSSRGVPEGAIPRSSVTNLVFIVSGILLSAVRDELLLANDPMAAADPGFISRLSASAALQHLLLLHTGLLCHIRHKQQQGLSYLTTLEVAAAVTGSRQLAAAADAAEAALDSSSSST